MTFSERIAAGRQVANNPVYPESLDELLAEAVAEGWKQAGKRSTWSARVELGTRSAVLTQTQAGTQVRVGMSTWGGVMVTLSVLVLLAVMFLTAVIAKVA